MVVAMMKIVSGDEQTVWGRRKTTDAKGAVERGEETLRDTTEVNKDFKRKGVSRGFEQGRREKEKKRSWQMGDRGDK